MVRLDYKVDLQYEAQGQCDFELNICPAHTASQRVFNESIAVNGSTRSSTFTDPHTANRTNRLYVADGHLSVLYRGTVELHHIIDDPAAIEERAIRNIPSEVVPYILPSRYCQSDKMRSLAVAMFGNVRPGYWRVAAICEWVTQHVRFKPGAADVMKCAIDTFDSRAGVCRDYAHLMISMCRALNIPARYITGVDYGANAALGATDFHAYVEVFLGERWYLFDPSGISPVMGLIRIGTGRDAADVSFATVFGNARSLQPIVTIDLVSGNEAEFEPAKSMRKAVSTAAETLHQQTVKPAPVVQLVPSPMRDKWISPQRWNPSTVRQFA